MNKYKVIRLFTIVILVIAGKNLIAGGSKEVSPYNDKYEKGTLFALNSDNLGVIESSLFLALELKDRYPSENYSNVVDKIDDISNESSSLSIKYKAQLAEIYYKYYDLFSDIKIENSDTPDKYFKIIADRIAQSSLVSN